MHLPALGTPMVSILLDMKSIKGEGWHKSKSRTNPWRLQSSSWKQDSKMAALDMGLPNEVGWMFFCNHESKSCD